MSWWSLCKSPRLLHEEALHKAAPRGAQVSTTLTFGGWHLRGHAEEKTDVDMATRSLFHCKVSMPQRRTPRVTGRIEGTYEHMVGWRAKEGFLEEGHLS